MKNYNKELDDLFVDWERESENNGLSGFCKDGLLNKGHIFKNDDGYWGRTKGNENELWHNASKRVLFLMKDSNGNPGEDMRTWIGRQHPTDITFRFFKQIALWLYGINSILNNGIYKSFTDADNVKIYSKAFDDLPIAIVNCKKESGGGSISNRNLINYAHKYQEFLKKQLKILNPNIIYCGGGSGTVLQIAKDLIYKGFVFQKINNWIYYENGEGIILIDGWHPSYYAISYQEPYEDLMEAFKDFYRILNER